MSMTKKNILTSIVFLVMTFLFFFKKRHPARMMSKPQKNSHTAMFEFEFEFEFSTVFETRGTPPTSGKPGTDDAREVSAPRVVLAGFI